MSNELQRINELYVKIQQGGIEASDISDADLPKLARASANFAATTRVAEVLSEFILEELRHRRGTAASLVVERSSAAMAKLTRALVLVAWVQAIAAVLLVIVGIVK